MKITRRKLEVAMESTFLVLDTYNVYYDFLLVHLAIGAATKIKNNYIKVQCLRILRLKCQIIKEYLKNRYKAEAKC